MNSLSPGHSRQLCRMCSLHSIVRMNGEEQRCGHVRVIHYSSSSSSRHFPTSSSLSSGQWTVEESFVKYYSPEPRLADAQQYKKCPFRNVSSRISEIYLIGLFISILHIYHFHHFKVSLPKILFCDRSRRMRIPYVLRIHSFCEKTFVTGMSVCRTTL